MDKVAREAVGGGEQHPVERGPADVVPQGIQTGTLESGTALPVVAEDVARGHLPALRVAVVPQMLELLVNRLRLGLPLGRDPHVDRGSHGRPPGDFHLLTLRLAAPACLPK